MSKWVLILGATSAIARATAAACARRGYALYLAGRDLAELDRDACDLALRYGIETKYGRLDAQQLASHAEFFATVLGAVDDLEGIISAIGYLGDQTAARQFPQAARVIETNFTGPASLLALGADYLEQQGKGGVIVGISSVAGDRGRQSNYVYGAAKGALTLYLQGLRNRLQPAGVRVVCVKPGFVDTAMTFGMPGLFLMVSPEYVGERIARALEGKSDVLYVPWFWRYIMLIIRTIPEFLFKRLKL